MATNRRSFLKNTTASLVGLSALSSLSQLSAATPAANNNETPRFIFIRKGNGLFPSALVPPSLSEADKNREKSMAAFEADLSKHELPDWLMPLNAHKKHMTLLQGLSAKMCTMGHSTYQSPLAVSRSAERPATITRATVDIELARMFTSPFEHIELTCARNQKGVVSGMSAIGPKQPNYAFASPSAAFENLFSVASGNKEIIMDQTLDNSLYQFISQNLKPKAENLNHIEGEQKIGNYADSVDTLIKRNKLLQSMSAQIKKYAPTLNKNVMQDQYTTVEQQEAFVEILLGALYAGLTNVVTFTIDDLGTNYSGLFDFEVMLHDVGHGKENKGVSALDQRTKVRTQHMKMVERIVNGLKKMPEGKGTMFDNTIIMYLPENGETHHSQGTEVPFVILAGDKVKLRNIGSRYIRLPNYDEPGHKTLGNFYTTLLNAYGNPIKHYGDFDVSLKIDQAGPIKQLMA